MRKCCCCISVHTGTLILGIAGILVSLLELVPIVPYLADMDGFNPIKENLKEMQYVGESILEEHNMTQKEAKDIMDTCIQYLGTTLLVEAVLCGLFALFSILVVLGVLCKKRIMMLPYMILFMICILFFVLLGLIFSVFAFFVSVITGSISLSLVLIVTFLCVYFWTAVQKSFKELGNRDYMYSPAPMSGDGYGRGAPQSFDMA